MMDNNQKFTPEDLENAFMTERDAMKYVIERLFEDHGDWTLYNKRICRGPYTSYRLSDIIEYRDKIIESCREAF
jgi:hypothetical protein